MTTTPTPHTVRWYGVIPNAAASASPDEGTVAHHRDLYVPRTSHMNGRDWGWDAICSCGWESRTGGALQVRVREAIADHRWDVANGCVS